MFFLYNKYEKTDQDMIYEYLKNLLSEKDNLYFNAGVLAVLEEMERRAKTGADIVQLNESEMAVKVLKTLSRMDVIEEPEKIIKPSFALPSQNKVKEQMSKYRDALLVALKTNDFNVVAYVIQAASFLVHHLEELAENVLDSCFLQVKEKVESLYDDNHGLLLRCLKDNNLLVEEDLNKILAEIDKIAMLDQMLSDRYKTHLESRFVAEINKLGKGLVVGLEEDPLNQEAVIVGQRLEKLRLLSLNGQRFPELVKVLL